MGLRLDWIFQVQCLFLSLISSSKSSFRCWRGCKGVCESSQPPISLDCSWACGRFFFPFVLPLITVQSNCIQPQRKIHNLFAKCYYVNTEKSTSSVVSWCWFTWLFFLLFDGSWSATFLNSWNPWISPFLMLASSCNVNDSINMKTTWATTWLV